LEEIRVVLDRKSKEKANGKEKAHKGSASPSAPSKKKQKMLGKIVG
jgi:hypothetical protein